MKKICSILLALVLIIVPMTISVSAATGDLNANEQKIIAALEKEVSVNGNKFVVPAEYVTQAKNYFKTIDVTDAQAEEILAYIAEGEKLVTSQTLKGTTNFNTFEPAVNSKILALGQKAVAVTGGVLVYDGKNVTITNAAGNTVFDAAPIVKQTGAEVDFTAIVLAAIAVVAMLGAAIVVAKKKALFVK